MQITKQFSPSSAPWLFTEDVQSLLRLLSEGGGEARIVGGAVRNTLLNEPVDDIDIATSLPPRESLRRARSAGFQTVPTGIDFGTITIHVNHRPFEVTSLRTDISTNGRHAVVAYGQDWHEDAQRRDFTINALYCDADGTLYDDVGALEDIKNRRIRFIGIAEERIREDYLRIMRFFRFFACYGKDRPEKDTLRAIVKQREGLTCLSAERIWKELKKLLQARNPYRSLLWMRQSGVLSLILPESEKWGLDLTHGLMQLEQSCELPADPLLRLESMIPPDSARVKALSVRLKLARTERRRLVDWAEMIPVPPEIDLPDLHKRLYQARAMAVADRLKLDLATRIVRGQAMEADLFKIHRKRLTQLENWQRPTFPLKGQDLLQHGYKSGRELGMLLAQLETVWVESNFTLTKRELLAKLS